MYVYFNFPLNFYVGHEMIPLMSALSFGIKPGVHRGIVISRYESLWYSITNFHFVGVDMAQTSYNEYKFISVSTWWTCRLFPRDQKLLVMFIKNIFLILFHYLFLYPCAISFYVNK